MFKKKKIYLDYAASTPIDPRVARVVARAQKSFANPSSVSTEGVEAKQILEEARTSIARLAQVKPEEILFTANATESNNLVIQGVSNAYQGSGIPHIITSTIEHPAILEVCRHLVKSKKAEVTYVGVDENGIVNPEEIKKHLKENTVLVSVMQANNEIGVIQPILQISKIVEAYRKKNNKQYPYMHTDASQCPCYLDFHVGSLGVDLLTLDGIKVYGPRGVGLLVKKNSVKMLPIFFGGGQEMGLRPGTENLPGIVGLSEALKIADFERKIESKRLLILRDFCINQILEKFPKASLNGSKDFRFSNNINICFPGIDAEFLVVKLDNCGIATSFSSSCRSMTEKSSSYVIDELRKDGCASSSIRITLGRFTKKRDIQTLLEKLEDIIPVLEN